MADNIDGTQLSQQVKQLQDWQRAFDLNFTEQDRKGARRLVLLYNVWLIVLGSLTALGVLSLAGIVEYSKSIVSEAENHVQSQIAQAQKAADEHVTETENHVQLQLAEAQKAADEHIEQSIDFAALDQRAFDATKRNWEDRFQRDFEDSVFSQTTGIATGVKLFIEGQLQGRSDVRYRVTDPRRLKELAYALDALMEQYGNVLRKGSLEPNRRKAFLYTINGILDRARGLDNQGEEWFELAMKTDPDMPEPYILLARLYVDGTRYQAGNWSDAEKKKLTSDLFSQAQKCPNAAADLEVARIVCEIATLNEDYPKAISEAKHQIDRERQIRGEEDPRLHTWMGFAFWEMSGRPGINSEEYRLKAARAMLAAYQLDPEYVKALNNYIWMMTHTLKDDLFNPLDVVGKPSGTETLTDQDIAELKFAVKVLSSDPLVSSYPRMFDTVAEAKAVLAAGKSESQAYEDGAIDAINQAILAAHLFEPEDGNDLIDAKVKICAWIKLQTGHAR